MEVARAGQELNQEVNRLMVAMRDMLANIRFQEPPRDDNPYRDEEEWDWEWRVGGGNTISQVIKKGNTIKIQKRET